MESEKKKHGEGVQDTHLMTHQQREELKAQFMQHNLEWLLVGAVLWIAAIVMLFVSDLGNIRWLVALTIIAVGLLPMIVGGRKWQQVNLDLQGEVVEYLDGVVSTYTQSAGRNGKTFHLSIASEKFMIPKDLFLSINRGESYRVYYSPHSRFVVGAEPL
jgi:hypothetical protein